MACAVRGSVPRVWDDQSAELNKWRAAGKCVNTPAALDAPSERGRPTVDTMPPTSDTRERCGRGRGPRFRSDADRLEEMWRRIDKTGACWIYTGPTTSGYGTHVYGGRPWRVHRLVYELMVGPIPEGMQLDHRCHTSDTSCPGGRTCPHRACCNPDHLEPVTDAENKHRGGNARKTACPQGHAYDQVIYRRSGAERRCTTCQMTHRAARRRRSREVTR